MRFSGRQPGFTLVELLISIAIMAILSAIVFVSFANEQERSAVKRAAEQLQVDIQDVQSRAQSGVLDPGSCGTVTPGVCDQHVAACTVDQDCDRRPDRYGIYINPSSSAYYIFADYDAVGTPFVWNSGEEIIIRSYPSDLEVAALAIDNPPVGYTPNTFDITYSVPEAAALVRSQPMDVKANEGTIILRQTKADLCYTVTVLAASGTVNRRELTTCP